MIAFARRAFLALLVALTLPAAALVPPPPAALRQVVDGLALPLAVVDPKDGSGRLFFAQQEGLIRVVRDGAVLPTPFLDLTSRIAEGGERGLLGLAFDPQYAANRRFFVFYTMLPAGDLRISSFHASVSNPDVADDASEVEIITIAHSLAANHNGGQLAFGPDGYLYAGTGDGGGAGDPLHNAQNLTALLGKILRLDVSGPAGYAIPPSNPTYAGVPGARREIWAYGLRNPWRFSFDRATGDLYIGDVGQNLVEEIDFMPAGTSGTNFGWPVFEGSTCFEATTCSLPGAVPPIQEYGHVPEGGFCVIGGFVYRGDAFPELRGFYLYGDYFTTRIWATARDASGAWQRFVLFEPPNALSGVSSFGEDTAGELYIASHGSPGHIHRIVRAGPDTPTPVSPMGTIATASPTYTWSAVQGVDQYMLVVQNTAEVRVNAAYSPTAAGCPGGTGTCSATPAVALAGNTPYNWFVHAANAEGTSPWSAAAPLLVSAGGAGNAPDAPVPIAPIGTVGTTTPAYSWNPVAGATSYALLVQNTSGVAVNRSFSPESIGCASAIGTCSAMPPDALANGVLYNWFVNATNAVGTGPWSAATAIAVSAGPGGPPAAPTLVSPGGIVTTTTPTYTWNAVSGAASYFLLVQNTAGVAVARSITVAAAACASGTGLCSATPGDALAGNTSYAWFVNAANAVGAGAWSAGSMIFVNAAGGAPAAPVPISPNGLLSTTLPTYVWNAVPGASSYFLLVQNTAGVAVAVDASAAAAGCLSGAGVCSVTPSTALASATPYAWFVRATGSAGTSDWSPGSAIRTP